MDIHAELVKRMRDAPMVGNVDPAKVIVKAKLFHAFGAGTWYLVQYDPQHKIGFGYVTGLAQDEWGDIDISALASLQFAGVPRIEVDRYFKPKPFSKLVAAADL
jgi:hypothetical protein